MIVGEVKEGRARLNDALRSPLVLEVALTRFGCCSPDHVSDITRELLSTGHVHTPGGHAIRVIAFGDSTGDHQSEPWITIPMRHVVTFLRSYLHAHWPVLRHAQIRDPVLGVLALIEKWNVNASAGTAMP